MTRSTHRLSAAPVHTARELAHPEGDDTEPPMRAGRRRYTTAKLCAVLAAYEFARRVPPEVATFNAFDPGQMPGTGLARDYPGIFTFAWRRVASRAQAARVRARWIQATSSARPSPP